jgi:hypothetical protein
LFLIGRRRVSLWVNRLPGPGDFRKIVCAKGLFKDIRFSGGGGITGQYFTAAAKIHLPQPERQFQIFRRLCAFAARACKTAGI